MWGTTSTNQEPTVRVIVTVVPPLNRMGIVVGSNVIENTDMASVAVKVLYRLTELPLRVAMILSPVACAVVHLTHNAAVDVAVSVTVTTRDAARPVPAASDAN